MKHWWSETLVADIEAGLADPLPLQPVNRELLEAVRHRTIGNPKQKPNFEFGKMELGDVWKDLLVSDRYTEKYHQVSIDFDEYPREPTVEQLT